jgi:hypothetical protein
LGWNSSMVIGANAWSVATCAANTERAAFPRRVAT